MLPHIHVLNIIKTDYMHIVIIFCTSLIVHFKKLILFIPVIKNYLLLSPFKYMYNIICMKVLAYVYDL